MFFRKEKPKFVEKPKICPLLRDLCIKDRCMMYRTRPSTNTGFCGMADQPKSPETHELTYRVPADE